MLCANNKENGLASLLFDHPLSLVHGRGVTYLRLQNLTGRTPVAGLSIEQILRQNGFRLAWVISWFEIAHPFECLNRLFRFEISNGDLERVNQKNGGWKPSHPQHPERYRGHARRRTKK